MTALRFVVHGKPIPQGSKRIGRNRATGKPILLDDNDVELRHWRAAVRDAAWAAMQSTGFETLDEPCDVEAVFSFTRPAGHYGTGKNAGTLRATAPAYPAVKPDLDKLLRACLDSMTAAAVFFDDSRVVCAVAVKRYGPTAGLSVTVTRASAEAPA
jgi:Holliday junction resolvase RusA-like endonuclease